MLQLLLSLALQYDHAVAKRMADLSAIAYQKQRVLDKWSCQLCQKYPLIGVKTHYSLILDAAGYLGYYPPENEIVVVFRGITDIRNWISDMHFKQVPYSDCTGCQVHKAFYDQFGELGFFVRDNVLLLKKSYPKATISVTGHSLGSSMAVFSSLDLQHFFGDIKHLYTFGMPRSGNKAFANYVAENLPQLQRIAYECDLIVHQPDCGAGGLQYWHPPRQIWLHNKTVVECSSEEGEDPACSNGPACQNYSYPDNDISKYQQ